MIPDNAAYSINNEQKTDKSRISFQVVLQVEDYEIFVSRTDTKQLYLCFSMLLHRTMARDICLGNVLRQIACLLGERAMQAGNTYYLVQYYNISQDCKNARSF